MRSLRDSKVLLTDGRNPSCLAFARKLGQNGVEVHVGESFKHNIAAYSKFTTQSHVYPPALEDREGFKAELLELTRREQFDFVIPIRDATTKNLAEMQDQLPDSTHTLLADPEQFERLNDKKRCAKLAESVGVPIPRTYYPLETSLEEIAEHAEFPLLVKPTQESGSRGIHRVKHPRGLQRAYDAVTGTYGDAIVQEFIDHAGGHFSIGTVFDQDSQIRALHVYKELLQYPDSGGPAIQAVSVDPEPWVDEMLDILTEIDWVGPAHMDVLLDPVDETFKLLEVNPRIWMSVNLSIESGVDIPGIIMRLANGGDLEPNPSYSPDYLYRWVVPNELIWLLSGENKLDRLLQLRSNGTSPICYGVLSRDDPQATAGVVIQGLKFLFNRDRRKMMFDRGWHDE